MMFLRQGTAATIRLGPFLDETDGKTAETALTVSQSDVKLSRAHAAFAQKNDATACTHDQAGWYACPLNATDTGTAGALTVAVHESGALPVWHEFMVLPQAIFDWLVAGSAVETTLAAIKAKTDLVPASPAAVGSAMTLTSGERSSIATAVMANTDADGIAVSTLLTRLNALARGNCSVTDNGDGTYLLAFKKEDGSTNSFTKTYNPTTGARS